MFNFFKSRFKSKSKTFKGKDSIKIEKLFKAKIIESNREVYVDKDAELIFVSKNEKNIFFQVKTNKLPRDSQTEAKTGDIIYFSLEEFKSIFN